MRIIDFADLDERQLADAARILREALPSPTAYKAAGQAEAELVKVRQSPDPRCQRPRQARYPDGQTDRVRPTCLRPGGPRIREEQ
jgi:hypothetical protein